MIVRRVLGWSVWFLAFFWFWMLLTGDWNRIEWIAGGLVAALAATIAEPIRRAVRVRLLVSLDVVRASALVLQMVFVDFGILFAVLVRALVSRHVTRGQYVTRPFAPGPKTTPAGAARRAWTVLLAGYSPNAYVVDIDIEGETILIHDLVPCRRSEEPA